MVVDQRESEDAEYFRRNSITQIGTGIHKHHDFHKHIVAGGSFDKYGNAFHGWQTALLPFMDQQKLYDSIRLDLPWHHSANAEVFNRQVWLFQDRSRSEKLNSSGYA